MKTGRWPLGWAVLGGAVFLAISADTALGDDVHTRPVGSGPTYNDRLVWAILK